MVTARKPKTRRLIRAAAPGIAISSTDGSAIRKLQQENQLLRDKLMLLSEGSKQTLLRTSQYKQAGEICYLDQKRFEVLIRNSLDNISLLTADGILLWESPAAVSTLDYQPDEFVGRNIFELMHPDDQSWARSQFTELVREPGSQRLAEFRLRHSSGSWRWVKAVVTNLLNEPDICAVAVNYRDITGRKVAEEEARKRMEDLALINTLNSAINRGESLETVLRIFSREANRILSCTDATIYLLSMEGKSLVMQNLTIPHPIKEKIEKLIGRPIPQIHIPLREDGYFRKILNSEQGIITSDPKVIQRWMQEFAETTFLPNVVRPAIRALIPQIFNLLGIRSTLTIPLVSNGITIGLLDLAGEEVFTDEDLQRIRNISGQVTAAILRKQADEKINEAEQRFRNLVETTSDWIWEIDSHGVYTYASPRVTDFLGYQPEEIIGKTPLELMPPDESKRVASFFRKALVEQAPFTNLQNRNLHKDGRIVILETSAVPILDKDGRFTGYRGIDRDVTQRVQAEEVLRESEERFRTLIHGLSNISIQGYAADGTIRFWNKASEDVYGYTAEEALGKNLVDIIIPTEMRPAVRAAIRHMAQTGEGLAAEELSLMRKDGSRVPVYSNHTVIETRSHGKELYCIDIDLTERKQAEEELHAAHQLLESIFEQTSALMAYLDTRMNFVRVNRAYALADEQDPSFYPGKNHFDLYPNAENEVIFRRAAETGVPHYEFAKAFSYAEHPERGVSYWDWSLVPVRDDQNKVAGLLLTLVNVTARIEAQHELQEREAQYRSVIETAPDGFWILDVDGRILEVNDAYLRQSGYTHKELLDMRVSDVEAAETQKDVKAHIEKITQKGSDLFESAHRVKNGRIWPVEVSASFTHAQGGRLFAFLRDISERREAEKKIERQIQQLKALSDIDRTIVSTFDLSFSLGILLQHVIASLEVSAADVLLFHTDSHMLEYAAGSGFRTRAVERTCIQLGEEYPGRAALERSTIYILNPADDSTGYLGVPRLAAEKFVSYFAVPLIAKGLTKGVLEVFHRAPLQPDAEWLEFLNALAGQAAIAIDNAQLFEGLQHSNLELAVAYDATIEGWSRAMDLRDKETEGHTRRVTELTLRLANILSVSDIDKVHMRRGALLHDMGKLGVPDAILFKADALTKEEWEAMHRHPTYAYEMLSPITYLKPALDIPYCHHERWNGTGYPRGLKEEQIPLAARIFAVVDVWDALRSDRPYRQAWSRAKAREYLRTEAGTQFDPDVVEAFLKMKIEE